MKPEGIHVVAPVVELPRSTSEATTTEEPISNPPLHAAETPTRDSLPAKQAQQEVPMPSPDTKAAQTKGAAASSFPAAVESLPLADTPIPTATPPPSIETTPEPGPIPHAPQPQPAPDTRVAGEQGKAAKESGAQGAGSPVATPQTQARGAKARVNDLAQENASKEAGGEKKKLAQARKGRRTNVQAAASAEHARKQGAAIARGQGTRWAEERRGELAEAQRRGPPAGTSAALAGLPTATTAAQAGPPVAPSLRATTHSQAGTAQAGGTESLGTGGTLGELTAVPVIPPSSTQAETGIAAVAPPGQYSEGAPSPQPGPASSVQSEGNQIGGLASPPQTLPPASTPAVSPEGSGQAESPQKDTLPGVAIQIERPQAGTTHQGVQALAGRIVGGTASEVVVHLNDSQQLLDVWGNTFEGEINLRPGNNQLRVVAMGPRGPIAEKSIEIRYVPPPPAWGVRVLRPANGTVLDSPGQDLIEVEGEVSEPGTEEARVTFNEFAIPVPVKDGRFSTIVPVLSREVTIRAEVRGARGTLSSDPVVIRRQPFKPSKGYLMLYLPTQTRKVEARMWLSHRPNPADTNSQRKVTSHFPSEAPGIERESTIFAFPAVQAGVYTLAIDYRVASGESVEKGWGLVFVPGPSGYRSLRLGPFQLTEKGRATLSKFILPYGIFWEEDFWFSGTAEGSDSFTKFRHPDGVSWTEKKGEPEFPTTK